MKWVSEAIECLQAVFRENIIAIRTIGFQVAISVIS